MDIKINEKETIILSFGINNGNWQNNDIDLIPTIKLRTGTKNTSELYNRVTIIALSWLKYSISFRYKKRIKL